MVSGGEKVTGLRIAYIGGGSRGWARGLMSDLAVEQDIGGVVKLYDIDQAAAADNEKIGNMLQSRPETAGRWRYEAVADLRAALTGADFIIISILPGTFAEMESDVHAPEKYGIYQPVGDTVGPGGLFRALRTIPMYVEIARAIQAWAPEAWVINYTNPMTLCVRTLYEIFPQVKAFGCCHEVFGTQKLLAAALLELRGIAVARREAIKVNVLGINHFTWIDRASCQQVDLMPVFREFASKYHETGYTGNGQVPAADNYFASRERVKFDLFRRYGLIAAAGDRHLAEFVPGSWYLQDPAAARAWGFTLTPVAYRKEELGKRLAESKALVSGEIKFEMQETGEEGVRQIKALLGLQDLVTNVNLPNIGQMQGVPSGAVVETNAVFSNNSVRPVAAGRLPDPVNNLVIRQIYNQETILRAAINKDYDLAFAAFVNDPNVMIPLADARKLFAEMLENTRAYL